jgi:hypothetical protein
MQSGTCKTIQTAGFRESSAKHICQLPRNRRVLIEGCGLQVRLARQQTDRGMVPVEMAAKRMARQQIGFRVRLGIQNQWAQPRPRKTATGTGIFRNS